MNLALVSLNGIEYIWSNICDQFNDFLLPGIHRPEELIGCFQEGRRWERKKKCVEVMER